jgi:tRNA threonylcarbamoyladenosine biosynthesis protein TsaE
MTSTVGLARRRWTTADPEATRQVGEELAAELAPDGLLLLSGDLGSGKTVLTQGIARGLGIDPGEVQSPTFTLVREHRGDRRGGGHGARLVHVDLYRLDPAEVEGIGLDELLAGPGVKVVEWAERLPFAFPGARRLVLCRTAEGREIVEEEPAR